MINNELVDFWDKYGLLYNIEESKKLQLCIQLQKARELLNNNSHEFITSNLYSIVRQVFSFNENIDMTKLEKIILKTLKYCRYPESRNDYCSNLDYDTEMIVNCREIYERLLLNESKT